MLASLFMLIYSIEQKLYPVIISNVMIFICSLIIMFLKKIFNSFKLINPTNSTNPTNPIVLTKSFDLKDIESNVKE